jgi:hypothetical protein
MGEVWIGLQEPDQGKIRARDAEDLFCPVEAPVVGLDGDFFGVFDDMKD